MRWIARAEIYIIFIVLMVSQAYAGPPFLTNDTDVTPYHQFQFYLYSLSDTNLVATYIQAPAIELDWGVAPNLELSLDMSNYVWLPTGMPNAVGLGDSYLSFEYRFWQESTYSPAIAIAPQVTLPTGDADRGLGNGATIYQLPIWFEKSFGSWTIDTGGGYNFNNSSTTNSYGFAGFLVQKHLNQKLTLGGEVFYQGAYGAGYGSYTVLNLGGSYNFTPNFSLLFSAGNSIAGQQTFISYLGLYWQTAN
jgi:hypothetical protein